MMKRTISILLTLALLLSLLCACQPSAADPGTPPDLPSAAGPAEDGLSCAQIVTGVLNAMDMESKATVFYGAGDEEPERLSDYIEETYGLSQEEWEDAYVARKSASSALEMTVLRCADEDAAAHALERLETYRTAQMIAFSDNKSIVGFDTHMLTNAAMLCDGPYVAMFACFGSAYAAQTFTQILDTGEIPDPAVPMREDLNAQLDMLLAECAADWDDGSGLERIDSSDPERLKAVIEEYGLTDQPWEEAVIARGKDGSIFEVAILRVANERDGSDVIRALGAYLNAKEEAYAHFPDQAELLSQADAHLPEATGSVVFAVGTEPLSLALELGEYLKDGKCMSFSGFDRHMSSSPVPSAEPDPDWPDRVKFAPPNEEDMTIYDTSAILAAWAAGDPAALSQEDRAVYDAAQEILGQILQDGMTGLEKETAVYRWMMDNVGYDWSHMDVMTETPRTAYEPYGALVDRAAVCLGYATGFQLLMDLAGVECITVVGACFKSTGDHAWNMVRLDGDWYCVDLTWDATNQTYQSGEYEWRYFNVSSDEMAAKDHQWDYASVPEATVES